MTASVPPPTDPETPPGSRPRGGRPSVPVLAGCLVWALGAGIVVMTCGTGMALAVARRVAPEIAAGSARRAAAALDVERADEVKALFDVIATRLAAAGRIAGELPETLGEAPPKDPWGRAVRYERSEPARARLASAGPDGRFGTKDDVERRIELP